MLRFINRILVRNPILTNSQIGTKNVNRLYFTRGKLVKSYQSALICSSLVGATAGYLFLKENLIEASCETKKDTKQTVKRHEVIRDDLPYYTDEELALHDNKYRIINFPGVDTSTFDVVGNACEVQREKGIWISYGVGVYDITKLIDKHGTPEVTIMLAAGMALDPFWDDEEMMKLHDKPYIYDMLENCRIGNIIKN